MEYLTGTDFFPGTAKYSKVMGITQTNSAARTVSTSTGSTDLGTGIPPNPSLATFLPDSYGITRPIVISITLCHFNNQLPSRKLTAAYHQTGLV